MRGSKAKKLRDYARKIFREHPFKAYEPLKPVRMFARSHVPGDVMPNPSVIWPGQRKMKPCIHKKYKILKQLYKGAPAAKRGMA
jgi:hypothetical protein